MHHESVNLPSPLLSQNRAELQVPISYFRTEEAFLSSFSARVVLVTSIINAIALLSFLSLLQASWQNRQVQTFYDIKKQSYTFRKL